MIEYAEHLAIMIGVYVILGTSFNLLVGYAGLFSVSQAAFYAIGAYATALLTLNLGWSFVAAMLVGIAGAVLVGALLAMPTLRVKGDYLVIASFGFQILIYKFLLNLDWLTRGPAGVRGIPKPRILGYEIASLPAYLLLTVVVAGLVVYFAHRLTASPFGRVLKGIREDEVAASALGKPVMRFKVWAFVFSAGLAAIAGSLYAAYVTFIDPSSFTLEESIFILTIVIVGGAGSIAGSVVGGVVLVLLPEALKFLPLADAVAAPLRQAFYGALLVAFMMFRPEGLIGEHREREPAVVS